jgi:hypothetical protein
VKDDFSAEAAVPQAPAWLDVECRKIGAEITSKVGARSACVVARLYAQVADASRDASVSAEAHAAQLDGIAKMLLLHVKAFREMQGIPE